MSLKISAAPFLVYGPLAEKVIRQVEEIKEELNSRSENMKVIAMEIDLLSKEHLLFRQNVDNIPALMFRDAQSSIENADYSSLLKEKIEEFYIQESNVLSVAREVQGKLNRILLDIQRAALQPSILNNLRILQYDVSNVLQLEVALRNVIQFMKGSEIELQSSIALFEENRREVIFNMEKGRKSIPDAAKAFEQRSTPISLKRPINPDLIEACDQFISELNVDGKLSLIESLELMCSIKKYPRVDLSSTKFERESEVYFKADDESVSTESNDPGTKSRFNLEEEVGSGALAVEVDPGVKARRLDDLSSICEADQNDLFELCGTDLVVALRGILKDFNEWQDGLRSLSLSMKVLDKEISCKTEIFKEKWGRMSQWTSQAKEEYIESFRRQLAEFKQEYERRMSSYDSKSKQLQAWRDVYKQSIGYRTDDASLETLNGLRVPIVPIKRFHQLLENCKQCIDSPNLDALIRDWNSIQPKLKATFDLAYYFLKKAEGKTLPLEGLVSYLLPTGSYYPLS